MSTPSSKQLTQITPTEEIRGQFPALEREHNGFSVAYFDAPGGTQTPRAVVDAVTDYLVKPFAFSELLARLEALLRRGAATATTTKLRVADLELDLLTRTVKRRDRPIEVLPREFRLLEYLMRNAGHVVTRTMLLEHVWDYHFDPQTNVIDVHISRLRQKIDKGFDSPLLHTVRGAGYCLRAADRAPQ